MNRDAVIKALEIGLDKNSKQFEAAKKIADRYQGDDAATLFRQELSKYIQITLEGQEEFRPETGLMVTTYQSRIGFIPQLIAPQLISKAMKSGSADAAVDWLEKILATKKAEGSQIISLYGVPVTNKLEITEDIELIPISDLPDSEMKDKVLDFSFERISTSNIPFELPSAALVCKVVIDPFISDSSCEAPEQQINKFSKHEIMINDILLALTLVGPCTPIRYISWFQYKDLDLEDALIGKVYSIYNPEIMPRIIKPLGPWDSETAKIKINQFLNLKEPTKKKVHIALERLNQAMRRSSVGDKALEISIAIESLLSDGPNNTYKIGLRSPLLLGGDICEMLHVRAIMEGVYALRSALVHKGEASKNVKITGEGKKESEEVLQEAIIICSKIISKILELNKIPNWFEFELSNRN